MWSDSSPASGCPSQRRKIFRSEWSLPPGRPGLLFLPILRPDCVVSLTRLHLQILVGQAQVDFSERAILLVIDGRVTDGVLAAHLILQFFEDVLQRMLPVHLQHMRA